MVKNKVFPVLSNQPDEYSKLTSHERPSPGQERAVKSGNVAFQIDTCLQKSWMGMAWHAARIKSEMVFGSGR